ncbi:MAG TPA: Phenylacetic acid catabolic protein, partial [Gaiellaceae bacterium]
LYELAAVELGTDPDALAFDREPADYACAPLVELRLLDDWAMTIARRYLYEQADRVRIGALVASADDDLAGLAAKIDREEVYHRLHAELWADRLRDEPRFAAAVDELWPSALGMLPPEQRDELARLVGREQVPAYERGSHTGELEPLWLEMTEVRRSIPGAQW